MASIKYTGESERVEFFGVSFEKGKSVNVDDAQIGDADKEALLAKADASPMFEVSGYEAPESDAPKRRGRPPKQASE